MAVHARQQRAREPRRRLPPRSGQGARDLCLDQSDQPAERLDVGVRQHGIRACAEVVEGGPGVQVLLREGEIGAHQHLHRIVGRCARERRFQRIRPRCQRARVHRMEQAVQRAEHVVERAHRIADALGDIARGEARVSYLADLPVCLGNDQRFQVGPAVIGTAGHDAS